MTKHTNNNTKTNNNNAAIQANAQQVLQQLQQAVQNAQNNPAVQEVVRNAAPADVQQAVQTALQRAIQAETQLAQTVQSVMNQTPQQLIAQNPQLFGQDPNQMINYANEIAQDQTFKDTLNHFVDEITEACQKCMKQITVGKPCPNCPQAHRNHSQRRHNVQGDPHRRSQKKCNIKKVRRAPAKGGHTTAKGRRTAVKRKRTTSKCRRAPAKGRRSNTKCKQTKGRRTTTRGNGKGCHSSTRTQSDHKRTKSTCRSHVKSSSYKRRIRRKRNKKGCSPKRSNVTSQKNSDGSVKSNKCICPGGTCCQQSKSGVKCISKISGLTGCKSTRLVKRKCGATKIKKCARKRKSNVKSRKCKGSKGKKKKKKPCGSKKRGLHICGLKTALPPPGLKRIKVLLSFC